MITDKKDIKTEENNNSIIAASRKAITTTVLPSSYWPKLYGCCGNQADRNQQYFKEVKTKRKKEGMSSGVTINFILSQFAVSKAVV